MYFRIDETRAGRGWSALTALLLASTWLNFAAAQAGDMPDSGAGREPADAAPAPAEPAQPLPPSAAEPPTTTAPPSQAPVAAPEPSAQPPANPGPVAVEPAAPVAPEPAPSPEAAAPTPPSAAPEAAVDPRAGLLSRAGYPLTPGVTSALYPDEFVLTGYAQAQYEFHQDSENQQQQGGALLNKDRFVLRRARIKVLRDWQWGQAILEVDGNTQRGPTARIQKAEVSVLYGRKPDKDEPPLVQLTLGQFDLPFGFETTYVPRVRWFMERSTAGRAFFPGEPDVGARISGGIAFARYAIAITNGEPLDERSGFGLQDPNANKDITARFGAEAKLTPDAVLAGGISFNHGRGFHAATDATKPGLTWRDLNENGIADSGEVFGLPGTQATPAKSFSRWAVGADIEFLLHTKIGWSMLYAEAVAASNLDRGLVIADPVTSGSDVRELGYYIAFTQEITRNAVVGFRYDYYDPNSDFLDKRGGKLIPTSQRIRTLSPLVAFTFPDRARLVFEWDITADFLARDMRGVPTDQPNNAWTLRLQGMF